MFLCQAIEIEKNNYQIRMVSDVPLPNYYKGTVSPCHGWKKKASVLEDRPRPLETLMHMDNVIHWDLN